jgi:hypothetical protein
VLALAGPAWGFLGTLVGVLGGGVVTLFVAIYNKTHDDPHVRKEDNLAGMRASLDAMLESMTNLRLDLETSERKHDECQRQLNEKGDQITRLSIELLRVSGRLDNKIDRPPGSSA